MKRGGGEPGTRRFAATVLIGFACLLPALISGQRQVTNVSLILFWTWLCVWAVLAGRMLIWALLTVGPLLLVSLAYWIRSGAAEDPFGFRTTLGTAFIILSFITAGTGVLSIVLTATSRGSSDAPPDRPGGR